MEKEKKLASDVMATIDAASLLVKKLDIIHSNFDYQGVWAFYSSHGNFYNGPTYEKELNLLKDKLTILFKEN